MAININNLNSNSQVQQNQQAQVKQELTQSALQSGNNKTQVKSASQDSVSITPQAKQLNELQKKAINDGDYKVDAEKLAASIANFEFKLV